MGDDDLAAKKGRFAMQVERLMTRGVLSCLQTDSAERAAQIMWQNDCGLVPVVDDEGRLAGVVTDRDLFLAAFSCGARLDDVPVAMAWSHEVLTCRAGESIETAAGRMRAFQVRRLVVTDEDGRPSGTLSLVDLAEELNRSRSGMVGEVDAQELSRVLEAVSQPRPRSASSPAAPLRRKPHDSSEMAG